MAVDVLFVVQVFDTRLLGLLGVYTEHDCFETEALSKPLALCLCWPRL